MNFNGSPTINMLDMEGVEAIAVLTNIYNNSIVRTRVLIIVNMFVRKGERMFRFFQFALVFTGLLAISLSAEATHRKSACGAAVGCCSPVMSSCGAPAVCETPCAPVTTVVPTTMKQKVTMYREKKTEVVEEVTIHKQVQKKMTREYTYKVMQPVTKSEKRKEVTYTCEPKTVEFTYTAMEPVTTTEKAKVVEHQCKTETVKQKVMVNKLVTVPTEQTVTEYVPTQKVVEVPVTRYTTQTVMEKRSCMTYTCVPRTVTTCVPVCQKVMVPVCDPCGACGGCMPRYTCSYQTTMQNVTRTVMERVPQMSEYTVPVTRCVPVTQMEKRTICEMVPTTKKVTVNITKCVPTEETVDCVRNVLVPVTKEVTYQVTKCVAVTKKGTRTESVMVPHEKMVDYTYTECVWVDKKGTEEYYVCETVPEKVKQTKVVVTLEPYETEVEVSNCATTACGTSSCYAASGCGFRVFRGCCR